MAMASLVACRSSCVERLQLARQVVVQGVLFKTLTFFLCSFLLPSPACYCGDGVPCFLTYRSIGGLVRSATPMVLPCCGHLDSIKQPMRGDLFIGRGSRQRSLKKSLWCNPFKVSEYGRDVAGSMFEDHLRTDQDLNDALWQVSGARLVCYCRPGESCHADIIRRIFSERFPEVHDRDTEQAEPPTAQVLNYMAKLREVPEQSDGSSADEGAPER